MCSNQHWVIGQGDVLVSTNALYPMDMIALTYDSTKTTADDPLPDEGNNACTAVTTADGHCCLSTSDA